MKNRAGTVRLFNTQGRQIAEMRYGHLGQIIKGWRATYGEKFDTFRYEATDDAAHAVRRLVIRLEVTEDMCRHAFASNLKAAMIRERHSCSSLAKAINVKPECIERWRQGRCFPLRTDTLVALCTVLNVDSIDGFVKREERKQAA